MTKILWLIYEFFKTGLFSIGGGLATLPYLSRMGQAHAGWFTPEMLANMVAISESTPGPMGVNMATYVGYTVAGVPGAVIATLSLVAPSVIIIMLIYKLLQKYVNHPRVQAVFSALRPAVTGLIAAAGLLVVKVAMFRFDRFGESGLLADLFNWKALTLAAVLLVLTRWAKPLKKLHPIFFILGSAIVGVVFAF